MDSRLLLRTNPKLTGNIKIVVDSSDKIYLNSISANSILSQSYFQKFQVSSNSNVSNDVNKFFNSNATPTGAIFDTGRMLSDKVISPDFKFQYEKQYEYGFGRNNNGRFSEQFSLFAPFFIGSDRSIPSKFVIFRMENPLPYQPLIDDGMLLVVGAKYTVQGTGTILHNGVYYSNSQQFTALIPTFVRSDGALLYLDDSDYEYKMLTSRSFLYDQLVDGAQIAKVYDLSPDGSNIGRYINNHITDVNYTDDFLNVDFKQNTLSYNGIHIDTGIISNIEENISGITTEDMDILTFDEYVTEGWERNRMISHRVLNLEFLFDDLDVPDYKFYRYYGLYVNDVDFAQFPLRSDSWTVTPDYKNPYVNSIKVPYGYNKNIPDADGIKLIPDSIDFRYTGHIDYDLISNKNMFCYVKDANNTMHKIRNSGCTTDTLCLNDTNIDLNEIFGFTDHIEEKVDRARTAGKASTYLEVGDVVPLGTVINLLDGAGQIIAFVRADHLPTLGHTPPYGPGQNWFFYFYPTGTTAQIAQAIKLAFRSAITNDLIVADNIGGKVYLKCVESGYDGNFYSLQVVSPSPFISPNITLFKSNFSGGTDFADNRIVVLTTAVDDLAATTYINCEDGYGVVKDVALYLDEPAANDRGDVLSYGNVDNYRVLTLSDKNQHIKVNSSNQTTLNKIRLLKYGVFDIMPIGDFDCATKTSDYTKSYTDEYYKYYHSQILKTGDTYAVLRLSTDTNNASITHGGVTYINSGGPIPTTFTAVSTQFIVAAGNPIVVNLKYQYDDELIKFIGFNSISRLQSNNSSLLDTDDILNKEIIISDTSELTEYDRLFENVKSYLALTSKVVPNITKWAMAGGKDVRGNPYRLNLSLAFGEMNFTPSQFDDSQNPIYFTHEWFYLGGVPEMMDDDSLRNSVSYMFKPFDRTLAMNQHFDYFTDYFETDFNYLYNTVGDTPPTAPDDYEPGYRVINRPLLKKYSTFNKISNTNYTTFFRGVQLSLTPNDKTIDYTGYKFAAVINFVNTVELVIKKPVSIELIENTNFKAVTLFIQIVADDYKVLANYYNHYSNENNITFTEYLYLYAMNSLKEYDSSSFTPTFPYLYGLEFFYPLASATGIILEDNIVSATTVTTFRGVQFFNQLDYTAYVGASNILNFVGYKEGILLSDELKIIAADHTYGRLVGIDAFDFLVITSDNGFSSTSLMAVQELSSIISITDKQVILSTVPSSPFGITPPGGPNLFTVYIPGVTGGTNINPVALDTIYPLESVVWFAEGGGSDIYQISAKLTSFSSISNCVNNDLYITHTTVLNGVASSGNSFKLTINQPDVIAVNSYETTQKAIIEYPDLPHVSVYDYNNIPVNTQVTYYRYSGNYEPIIKDVVKFGSFKDTLRWSNCSGIWNDMITDWTDLDLSVIILDFVDGQWVTTTTTFQDIAINNNYIHVPLYKTDRDLNVSILLDTEDSGIIHEYYYHKISGLPIISLVTNPVYPAINEICIDNEDKFIFEPSLSPVYYRQYTDKVNYTELPGDVTTYEDKSFMNGKQLKVPDTIVITNPVYVLDTTITPTAILSDDNIHYFVDSSNILYIALRHISILSDTIYANSADQFDKYFRYFKFGDPTTLIKQYIATNIMPDFGSPTMNMFLRDNSSNTSQITPQDNTLTSLQRIRDGYILQSGIKVTKTADQMFLQIPLKALHKFDMILDLEFTLGAAY